jgi:hypothetical protein
MFEMSLTLDSCSKSVLLFPCLFIVVGNSDRGGFYTSFFLLHRVVEITLLRTASFQSRGS